jgi:hypothetical protein
MIFTAASWFSAQQRNKGVSMFLPEELDNKTFRLFVQRTWYLQSQNLTLSRTEQELADLLSQHPEVCSAFTGKMLEVTQAYPVAGENPYLLLAALWEISKQIKADKPKGIRSIYLNGFVEQLKPCERRRRMARAFIQLCSRGVTTLSDTKYLHDLEKAVHTDFGQPEASAEGAREPASFNIYVNTLVQESISSVKSEFHDEASGIAVYAGMRLATALNKLPTEWVNGIAAGWQRPEKALRTERIQDLADFLLSEEGFLQISAALSAEERSAIQTLLDHNGFLSYGKLAAAYGDESKDEYYWSEQPPRTVIGRLRYKGLVFVGKVVKSGRRYKTALIPKELIAVLKNL